ncbi:hypothetical protein PVK06_003127 [Gossypium arboreum]|uniref:Uncharacterized protein n=1 Tax=Gossypium arboreum TaxID=29729 RepID=A0ABR0R6N1_GOSAR|nr:hypothetical protein PVK06_003127 [Gossypium arboreum]
MLHEVEQRGVQKLLEAITVMESVIKLGSSKFEERGVCEKNYKEDNDGNDISDNSGNEKPQVRKKKPNRKRDKLKCFLCNDPRMLKKCLNKSTLKEKPVGYRSVRRSLSSKGRMEQIMSLRSLLRNCPKQVVVKGKATSELGESSERILPEEDVSLSSNLEQLITIKTANLGPMRLNLSETSELAESSTRLPPMGEVGVASDFKEKK